VFAGRGAFLLTGAMLATIMTANVAMVIIPGQRKVIAQMKAGQPVDPQYGLRAKQRSVHNTYFTLPVLFAMLSTHYGMLHQAPNNWLVLLLMMAAGALIRQFFLLRHKGVVNWWWPLAGCVLIAGTVVWMAPQPKPAAAVPATIEFAQVRAVIEQRCVLCHNAQVAQKNVALHTPALVQQHALQIYEQSVVQKLMPLNNATAITDAERELLRAWFVSGAPVD
jgi:uncharacterized membrane protein